ncbi:hypothetical protein [Streptomyces goshikiensis]|uniref:hypothetical protein n=1 Tax=Streptomyces goshikiensis TaxID=1942 RepID=UPI0036954133
MDSNREMDPAHQVPEGLDEKTERLVHVRGGAPECVGHPLRASDVPRAGQRSLCALAREERDP